MKNFSPTNNLDEKSLKSLGIYEDVKYLFDNIGWFDFLTFVPPTVRRLTLEFFSSAGTKMLTHEEDVIEEFLMFRLLNRDYQLSFNEINEIFGFPTDSHLGPDDKYCQEYDAISFWKSLTGCPSMSRVAQKHR